MFENGEAFCLDFRICLKTGEFVGHWLIVMAENEVLNGNLEGLGH